jgi:glyoxylase-like metal-dependent hydrolase (beta-lactamase superfamily II)
MRLPSIAMILLLSLSSTAQVLNPIASNKKGLEILRKSQAAYGGAAATDSFKLSFSMRSEKNISRGQSLTAAAPFEPQFAYYDFMIDRPKGLETEYRKSSIAGFIFESNAFYRSGKGTVYDPLLKQYSEVNGSSIAVNMTYLPHNIIPLALRAPLSVRYIGDEELDGNEVHVLSYSTGGSIDNIYIDKMTYHIRKLQRIYTGVSGEELNEFIFKDHRKVGRLVIPQQTDHVTHSSVYGNTINVYTFTNLKTDFTIDTASMKVPAGYKVQDYSYRKKSEVRQLAKDVYLIENITNSNFQWSYNVFFVVMDDYVVVAEAPLNSATSERVIAKIKETAPGKPIKYLVQSHHHDDHLGGIRGYIAEGTTIITTAHNVDLINKIARVPYNVSPDRLSHNPKPVNIELVKNKKLVLKDASHEVVIYDIGPNPHANEMLMVYLPNERIIYEADMVNKGEYPMLETGRDFLQKIKALGLKVDKIASLHGQLIEGDASEKLMATGSW